MKGFWGGLSFLSLQASPHSHVLRADHGSILHVCSRESYRFWLLAVLIALQNIWKEPAGFSWSIFIFSLAMGREKLIAIYAEIRI